MASHDDEIVADYEEFNMRGSLINNSNVVVFKRSKKVMSPRLTKHGFEIYSRPGFCLIDKKDYEVASTGLYFAALIGGGKMVFRGVECKDYLTKGYVLDDFTCDWMRVNVYNLTDELFELPPYCILGYLRLIYE